MDKKLKEILDKYNQNDGLTKEERRQMALKIAEAREQMINDIVNHNKRILQKQEEAFEEFLENYEPECEEGIFFFDFAHPFASLFASWFANR